MGVRVSANQVDPTGLGPGGRSWRKLAEKRSVFWESGGWWRVVASIGVLGSNGELRATCGVENWDFEFRVYDEVCNEADEQTRRPFGVALGRFVNL